MPKGGILYLTPRPASKYHMMECWRSNSTILSNRNLTRGTFSPLHSQLSISSHPLPATSSLSRFKSCVVQADSPGKQTA